MRKSLYLDGPQMYQVHLGKATHHTFVRVDRIRRGDTRWEQARFFRFALKWEGPEVRLTQLALEFVPKPSQGAGTM